jgi:hypothetical protein
MTPAVIENLAADRRRSVCPIRSRHDAGMATLEFPRVSTDEQRLLRGSEKRLRRRDRGRLNPRR